MKQLDDYHIFRQIHIAAEGKFFSKFISSLVSPICLHANPDVMICNLVQDPNVSWVFFQSVCCWMILPVMNSSSLSLSRGFFCTSKSLLCPLHHLAMFCCNSRLPPEGCKLDNHQQYVIIK